MQVKRIVFEFQEPVELAELDILTLRVQNDYGGLCPYGMDVNGQTIYNTSSMESVTDENEDA